MTFDDPASPRLPSADLPAAPWRVPGWLLVLGGSTLMGLFAASGAMNPWRAMIQWWTWGLLAGPIVWLDRRLPIPADALGRRAALHIPLSIVWSVGYITILMATDAALNGLPPGKTFMGAVLEDVRGGGIQWSVIYYWLLLGGHFAIQYHRQSRDRERRTTELERLLVQAQLSALRAQLNPHFLFNALNTISAEIERQPKVARRMLEHLGELLRLSLESARPDRVTLTEELQMLEHYLAIQRARFAGRLEVRQDIDAAASEALVPGLLLQPLVENAIRHGLASRARTGRLRIAARVEDERLRLTVEDDGVGLPDGWALDTHAGIGLANTRRRLDAQYGARHTFAVRPPTGGGVSVEVTLPLDVARAPAPAVADARTGEASSDVVRTQAGGEVVHANADR